jgi:hypothetical protein
MSYQPFTRVKRVLMPTAYRRVYLPLKRLHQVETALQEQYGPYGNPRMEAIMDHFDTGTPIPMSLKTKRYVQIRHMATKLLAQVNTSPPPTSNPTALYTPVPLRYSRQFIQECRRINWSVKAVEQRVINVLKRWL